MFLTVPLCGTPLWLHGSGQAWQILATSSLIDVHVDIDVFQLSDIS